MTERTEFEVWSAREVARLMALGQAERRYYQEMVAALPLPVAVVGRSGSVDYANRAFRSAFGLRADDVRRLNIRQLLSGDAFETALGLVQTQRSVDPVTVPFGDQSLRVSLAGIRHWDNDEDLETLLLLEDLAPETGEIRRTVATSLPDVAAVVWEANAETLVFESVWGDTAAFSGYPAEHWLGTNYFSSRIHADDREQTLALYRSTVASGGEATAEFRTALASGKLGWWRETIRVSDPSMPERTIRGVVTDITNRKTAERQLLAGVRSDALRELAGKLAHDLNNPLMMIGGYTEEISRALPATSPARADLGELTTAADRIAKLAGKLTEYGRAQAAGSVEAVALDKLIDALGADLVRIAGAGAAVKMECAMPLTVLANREQLIGVILALAAGVREGAAERTKVEIACSSQKITEQVEGGLRPGRYAAIRVSDDGRGVAAQRRAAIFEAILEETDPSSWALPRAYRLIREWGGSISIEDIVPGTAFAILLPQTELPAPAPEPEPMSAPAAAVETPAPQAEGQRETILVVDDEAGIRGLVRKILRRERYQVLEAGTAEDALAIAVSHGGPIHMLLTDLTLPGMSGSDLARRMYSSSPSLKVLYISGYTADEGARRGEYPPGARFLPKPFTLGALVAKVRETLDA